MPDRNGRLICSGCGSDLGDAGDPYRDPTCGNCLRREQEEEDREPEDGSLFDHLVAGEGLTVADLQELIDTGQAWLLEGSVGRACQAAIDEGLCTVGPEPRRDFYGSLVPSIGMLEPGTVGTPGFVAALKESY